MLPSERIQIGFDDHVPEHVSISHKIRRIITPADYDTFQDCIDDAGEMTGIYLHDKYTLTEELDFSGKNRLYLIGPGEIAFNASTTQRSMLSLIGADNIHIRDMWIHNENTEHPPQTILAVGRNADGAGGGCSFVDSILSGYVLDSLVYSVAAEGNAWCRVFFILNGTGKNCMYFSQTDDHGLGGFTAQTAITQWITNCHIINYTGDPEGCCVYIAGSNVFYDFVIDKSYEFSAAGCVNRVLTRGGSRLSGPVAFREICMETYRDANRPGVQNFFLLEADQEPETYMYNLQVVGCSGGFGGTPDPGIEYHFIYGTDSVVLSGALIHLNSYGSNGNHNISLRAAIGCDFFDKSGKPIVVRDRTQYCTGNVGNSNSWGNILESAFFERGKFKQY